MTSYSLCFDFDAARGVGATRPGLDGIVGLGQRDWVGSSMVV